jgi:hypothetical protein
MLVCTSGGESGTLRDYLLKTAVIPAFTMVIVLPLKATTNPVSTPRTGERSFRTSRGPERLSHARALGVCWCLS